MDAVTDSAIRSIEANGYCVLNSLLDSAILMELAVAIKLGQMTTGEGKDIPRLNSGSDLIYSPFLVRKEFFDLFRHPVIDEILRFFLNDKYYKGLDGRPNYVLRSMLCRSSKHYLPWHIDSFVPYPGPHVISMQVIIPLEAFTLSNGPTLIKPGSHLSGEYSLQGIDHDVDIVKICADVGDVIIWDARLWHAAMENTSVETRWAAISTFTRWWIKQNYQYCQQIRDCKIANEYSDDDLIILGCASETPYSHLQSVDLKGGMDRIELMRLPLIQ